MNQSVIDRKQGGVMLLEALVAIAIFAFGLLGLLGLQVNSAKQSTNAKFRSDASLLADELVGKMWVSDRNATSLQNAFSSPSGSEYLKWVGDKNTPGSVLGTLPGAGAHPPDVTINQIAGGGSGAATSSVSVTLYWKAPYEQGAEHQYTVVTRIR